MNYREIYENAYASGKYVEHISGDTSLFRYPHMTKWKDCFRYDSRNQVFMFEGTDDELREIAAEDITIYEFIVPEARKLHLSDMLSCPYTEQEKQIAMDVVSKAYQNRKEIFGSTEIRTLAAEDLPVRSGYAYIGQIYEDYMDIPVRVVCFDSFSFPFGSVLKGTNIIITDRNGYNLSQDMLHMLFHLREGIEGPDGDNMFVKELWSAVPELYALQLSKGRMSRRIRMKSSPHPIHFTDYIYLRAYLGQAFYPEDMADRPHPVYSFIEPAIRLIFKALEDLDEYDRNRILSDAVLLDRIEELTDRFDGYFGKGSFYSIFDQYSLYDKYRLAGKYIGENQLRGIMFKEGTGLETGTDQDTIMEHWRKAIHENTIVLPAGIL